MANYQDRAQEYLAGGVVDSSEPVLLDVIDESLIESLKQNNPGRGYGDISGYARFNGRDNKVKPVFPDLPGYEEVTTKFCEVTGRDRMDIDERYGWYRSNIEWFKHYEAGVPHIDAAFDNDGNFLPPTLTTLAIGAQTIVWVGKIKRRSVDNPTEISPVKAKRVKLREGGIYLLEPITAHTDPSPPLLIPRRRYFWRSVGVEG